MNCQERTRARAALRRALVLCLLTGCADELPSDVDVADAVAESRAALNELGEAEPGGAPSAPAEPTSEPPPPPKITLGDVLKPVLNYFDCAQADASKQQLCRLIRAKVDAELRQANLSIDAGGILSNFDSGQHIGIDTGHSCTVTAKITRRRSTTLLGSGASLDFHGDSVSDPLLIAMELPVTLSMHYDLQQEFGSRFLGKCHGVGSDSYSASGTINTRAQLAVVFTLGPSLRTNADGDLVLTLHPILRVSSNVVDTNVSLQTSGISPISGVATALLGGPSTLLKALTALVKGDSVRAVFSEAGAITDLVNPVVLTLLSGPLQGPTLELAKTLVEPRATRQAGEYVQALEQRLTDAITNALKLDRNGDRVFVIRKEFAELLAASGEGADLFLPTPPLPPPAPIPPRPRPERPGCPRCLPW